MKFGGGVIKVSTDVTVIPAGWEVTINQQYTPLCQLYAPEKYYFVSEFPLLTAKCISTVPVCEVLPQPIHQF